MVFSDLLDWFISLDWFLSSDWYDKHRPDRLHIPAHEHSILSCIYDRNSTWIFCIKIRRFVHS